MAIKENVLPLAQSSGSGTYIRTLSSGGESQRASFDIVKGAITADMDDAIEAEAEARESADTQLETELNSKVDKVTGKGLSTNDFTNALKTKLDGIETGAEVNVIETVKVNGTALVPDANRAVNVPSPTVDSALSTTSTNPVQNKVITGAVNDLKEEINDKLNWTVGSAEQLVSDEASATDVTPYTFRRSGGGLIPFNFTREELAKVVGGTVAWNQLMQNGNFVETSGWSAIYGSISTSNNECVYTITNQDSTFITNRIQRAVNIVSGHKYLVLCGLYPTKSGTTRIMIQNNTYKDYTQTAINSWNDLYAILDTSSGGSLYIQLSHGGSSYAVNDSYKWRNVCITDLTAMFGTAIADYVYSLEQATAGAGVAWLKQHFPKMFNSGYMAYDAGTLKSVEGLQSHNTVGKNLFENTGYDTSTTNGITWKKNPDGSVTANGTATADAQYERTFIADTLYGDLYFNGAYGGSSTTYQVYMWDLETHARCKKWDGTTNSSNAYKNFEQVKIKQGHQIQFTLRVSSGNTVNNVTFYPMICLPTTTDNNFEPYTQHTYALDSDLMLRGIPKLDSNNNLYYDGDEYASDGSVTRKYGVVDLGTLNWVYNSTYGFFGVTISDVKTGFYNNLPLICSKYSTASNVGITSVSDKEIGTNTSGGASTSMIIIKDSSYGTDAAAFKTAMNGVKLVYEKATPTTETADPYTAVQICDSDGTEEFVDALVEAGTRDLAIPAGTETIYFEDMAGKLAELPPIPSAPSANGTYTLQAVVSSGAVTYQWTS